MLVFDTLDRLPTQSDRASTPCSPMMEVADLDVERSIAPIVVEVAVCGPGELFRIRCHGQDPGASMSLNTLLVFAQSNLLLLVLTSVLQMFASKGA